MGRRTEAVWALVIGAIAGPILDVVGIQSGVLRGILAGLIAVPYAAALAAILLLLAKLVRNRRVAGIDLAMFAFDLVAALVSAFLGILAFDVIETALGLHLDSQG